MAYIALRVGLAPGTVLFPSEWQDIMCGLFGYIGRSPTPETIASALRLLGHRGHDGFGFWCGLRSSDHFTTAEYRQTGADLPALSHLLPSAEDMIFLGHWRYSTRGGDSLGNSQPVLVHGGDGAIVHNGQFRFSDTEERASRSDTLRFAEEFADDCRSLSAEGVYAATERLGGAFSLMIGCRDGMITARDRFAIRPFFYGHYEGGAAFASEVPALTALGCRLIAEIPPGSVTLWDGEGMQQCLRLPPAPRATCAFEQIYFHSAEGEFSGIPVWQSRRELGCQLASEAGAEDADIVVGVPNSGLPFALGYAEQSGIPEEAALTARKESGRTFIRNAETRETVIAGKYHLNPDLVRGKAVVLVDDS